MSEVVAALVVLIFFFNDTATTEIYTLSLHDALPISRTSGLRRAPLQAGHGRKDMYSSIRSRIACESVSRYRFSRSEEHTSELQSRQYLVCRLLLEKKQQPHVRALRDLPPPAPRD